MTTYIRVSDALRKELSEVHNLSRVSVWAALNFLTSSERAEEVRKYALAHGGVVVDKDFTPNCQTEHTQTEIIQTFAGDVQVIVSKEDSHARVLVDGKEEESYDGLTMKGWGNLLRHAQDLSEARVGEAIRR